MDWTRRPAAPERLVASSFSGGVATAPGNSIAASSGVLLASAHGPGLQAGGGSSGENGIVHSSPGLRDALARLPPSGASVLDLGSVSSVNVEFFNRLRARLQVLDFEGTLAEAGLWEAPAKLPPWAARVPEALDLGAEIRYDLILTWDFANYLGRERWPFVARELAARLSAHGSLHLLVRSGKQMPAKPGKYRIASKESILEEVRSLETLVPPRFAHAEVERLHPGLAAAKSFLDKHGLQEIVLERSEELNLPPRPQAQPRMRRS